MTISKPHQCTTLGVWFPRYSDQYTATQEKVALLARYKVDQGSPILLVDFTKAKHLAGQRYAIYKAKAQTFPVDSNGKIDCYAVPMSALEDWQTEAEVLDIALDAFPEPSTSQD